MKKVLLTASLLTVGFGVFAQFTPGNLAVVRAGNGTETDGASIHIDEYSRTGEQTTPTYTLTLPSADETGLVINNVTSLEGIATLSANRTHLAVTGYKAAAGTSGLGTSSVTKDAKIYRGYAIIEADGSFTMSEPLNIYSANAIRTAIPKDDGTGVWMGGGSSSLRYNSLGSATVNGVLKVTNSAPILRSLAIFNGDLYISTNSTVTEANGGPIRIAKLEGLPESTAGDPAYTILPGVPTTSLVPNAMVFLDADGNGTPDLLYVGDDNLGLTKYYYNNAGSTWVPAGNFLTTDNGKELRGLTGHILNGKVYLYGVAGTTTGNKLISLTDESAITITGANFTSAGNITDNPTAITMTVLATAPDGTSFKSVTFTPGTTETSLPVNLTSFTGKQLQQTVKLNWSTASEQNNSHFDVLRSNDGKAFDVLGSVAGNGTTNSASNYSFVDENPFAGTNYYQLSQVDFNGKSAKSGVIAVKTDLKSNTLSIYVSGNNEIQANIYSANSTTAHLYITDISGHKLADKQISLEKGYTKSVISIPGLQPGVYVASLMIGGKTESVKFTR